MLRLLTAAALATVSLTGLASAQDKQVDIAYVEWSDAVVATNLLAETLKSKGYEVTMTPLPAAAMWQAVATGEADAMVAAWLPVTHAAYYEELKDQVELVGPNVEGAKIGWAVPAYTDITSVDELATKADLVDGRVIGIDPGAGLMQASEKAIADYALPVQLVEGSDATMTAALDDAINRKENIVVTTWTPHWMFGRYDLKYLADPKGTFGGEETVNTVARKGLAEEMPEVHKILANFKISLEDEQKLMLENEEDGADPAATAKAWIDANPDKVAAWTN